MCKAGKERPSGHCILFGPVESWSRHAPLPPPDWLRAEIFEFSTAARLAARGDLEEASTRISALRGSEAAAWFDNHGQVSGKTRDRVLGVAAPTTQRVKRTGVTSSVLIRQVHLRDAFHCRYCGLPTIAREVTKALHVLLGSAVLPWGGTNATMHGVPYLARAEYDHVHPITLGGTDDESNLVTACLSCNYGKHQYTIAQLGLEDPRARSPVDSDWDGLISLLPDLKRLQRRTGAGQPTASAPHIAR